jgi:predicted deacylase
MSEAPAPTDPQWLEIGGEKIGRGKRRKLELFVAKLFDYTDMVIPVEVIRGRKPGPTMFVSAAIHGDEINGVEIIKRLLGRSGITALHGTLIAVPIVNVFGFNTNSRYLPDRRDLNRCFPGNHQGSLASVMAHLFMEEVVSRCTHGIDLHTGAIHRTNLPQIRADLGDRDTRKLAESFGVPVIINSSTRDGSLREAAANLGIQMLLYEGGEALRYDEKAIQTGLQGILAVMRNIGMLPMLKTPRRKPGVHVFTANRSTWVRAPASGSLSTRIRPGSRVMEGDVLGVLSDPFGEGRVEVRASKTGIVIGMSVIPLVSHGDGLFHIALFDNSQEVEQRIEEFDTESHRFAK